MKFRCLVIDDEPFARKILEDYIGKTPLLEHVGSCKNALEALEWLHGQQADVLFLDINMPELSGLDFLRTLPAHRPQVVFTTAYAEYAVASYELDATDYLLKPISFERFLRAVNKITGRMATRAPEASASATAAPYLLVRQDGTEHRVKLQDILYLESYGNYIKLHTSHGTYLPQGTLKRMEAELPSAGFLRIHRGYIVAVDKVEALQGNQLVVNGTALPIGEQYRKAVKESIRGKW